MSIFESFFEKVTGKKPEPQQIAPPQPTPPAPEPQAVSNPPEVTQAQDVSLIGLELIKRFEGCVLHAYPDPATGGDPWTIGYGHTGPEVVKGKTITQDEADALLRQDLRKFVSGVLVSLSRRPTQAQLDAMVSLAFNIGITNFRKSTLVRLFNSGDYAAAADQFLRWNKAAGKVMAGLTKRRTAEREVFVRGDMELQQLRSYISKLIVS